MESTDKKFISVFMYYESSKIDMEKFNKNSNIKYKFDWVSLVLLIVGIIFIGLGFVIYYLFILALIFLLLALFIRKRVLDKRKVIMLDILEKSIIKESLNYENSNVLSAVYPVYAICDNKNKIFKIIYQDKEYVNIEYDDILSYDIYIDRVKFNKRLPEKPDPRIRSYIIEIICKDNKKIEIGFSNDNKYFMLKGNYLFLQYANTKSINKIATILDKINKKSNV